MTKSVSDADPHRGDLVVAVTDAVAEATDRNPTELDPLYESIDPDALTALFAGRNPSDTRIEFEYQGQTVTIDGDGQVTVDPATPV